MQTWNKKIKFKLLIKEAADFVEQPKKFGFQSLSWFADCMSILTFVKKVNKKQNICYDASTVANN